MDVKKPTKKQAILLDFIEEFTAEHDYSPSYREIMGAMGLKSVSAVAEHIENCVLAGNLRKIPKSARSLEVVRPKTYEETVGLFRERMSELRAKDSEHPDIEVLKGAAKILGIEV
jgi:SOS-response transcriptional repressor LexA